MDGRPQLATPAHSTRRVSSVVRTVVEPPPPPSCPAMSRLPRASGLRPPRSYGSAPCAPQIRPPAPCAPQVRAPPPCAPQFRASAPCAPQFRPSAPCAPQFRPSAPCAPQFRPSAPCAPQVRAPPPCAPRPPPGRSFLRPPQASGLRPPSAICRPPQRARTPSPPRARSASPPCAPAPCPAASPPRAPAPCPALSPPRAPAPCPALSPPRVPAPCPPLSPPCAPPPCPAMSPPCPAMSPPCSPEPCPALSPPPSTEDCMAMRDFLLGGESDQEAAIRAALRAQMEAKRAAFADSPAEQLRIAAERRAAAELERRQREYRQAHEGAQRQLRLMAAWRERARRIQEEQSLSYKMTLEAMEEMLMEERDLKLREAQERMLREALQQVSKESEWHAALGIADNWRRNMLEAYQPIAQRQARLYANKEFWDKRKKRYTKQMRLPRPPLSPLEESQVDVFDESPPRAMPPPTLLPERVFDVPAPCDSLTLLDSSPPWDSDLPAPLLRSYESPAAGPAQQAEDDDWVLEFDMLRDPRRELTFDSEDDDSLLEGAVGGDFM